MHNKGARGVPFFVVKYCYSFLGVFRLFKSLFL